MIKPEVAKLVSKIEFVGTTGSTNADLIAGGANLSDLSVLVADFQSAGKGRSNRDWVAPAGSSLFVSILVKPGKSFGPEQFSWMPLLAGLAMQLTVADLVENEKLRVGLKWPNDVLIGPKKVSGVLSELLPDLTGVVIGAGLNLTQSADELPIATATSLIIETGTAVLRDLSLEVYLTHFTSLYRDFKLAGGNPMAAAPTGDDSAPTSLRQQVIQACVTIGQDVRVILPGDNERFGKATGIDHQGRLIVQPDDSGEPFAVAAGDIVHLRHNY